MSLGVRGCPRAVSGALWAGLALWAVAWVAGASPEERVPSWLEVDVPLARLGAALWTVAPLVGLVLFGCSLGWGGARLPGLRRLPRATIWLWAALAAGFAWSTLETVVHNDGVVGLAGHRWWGPALHVLVPVWGGGALILLERLARRAPMITAVLLLTLGAGLAAFVLRGPLPEHYRALHAHLWLLAGMALCGAWLLVAAAKPARRLLRPVTWISAVVLGGLLGLGAAAGAFAVPTRILLQRFAFPMAGWFDAVPAFAWLHRDLKPAEERLPSREEAHRIRGELTDPARLDAGPPRGRHVVLLVLESTRADRWGDPDITPRFAVLRRRGTWLRRAVAQYPATPLAYGAIFTSQPPSVLVQSAYWARHRLFDRIRGRFDVLFLSKPRVSWFERSAITSFFVPRGERVRRHPNSAVALRALRRRIERMEATERLFAWVHLYEPHDPYRPPPPFAPSVPTPQARYEGTLRYVDHHLGAFLEWFGRQPMARETLLIVVGDHGEALGDRIMGRPYWRHHVHVHGALSFVPMFLQGPGVTPGRIVEEPLLQQLDVMPTIFDFLGEDLPAESLPQGESSYRLLAAPRRRPLVTEAFGLRGKDFFALVEQVARMSPDARLARFERVALEPGQDYEPKVALQYGWEKVVLDRMLRRAWYFDLRDDPEERRDLSRRRPERFAVLRAMLRRWQRRQRWVATRLDAQFRSTERPHDAGSGLDGGVEEATPKSGRGGPARGGRTPKARGLPGHVPVGASHEVRVRLPGIPGGEVRRTGAPQPERGAP